LDSVLSTEIITKRDKMCSRRVLIMAHVVADYFSGQDGAIGRMCVSTIFF